VFSPSNKTREGGKKGRGGRGRSSGNGGVPPGKKKKLSLRASLIQEEKEKGGVERRHSLGSNGHEREREGEERERVVYIFLS